MSETLIQLLQQGGGDMLVIFALLVYMSLSKRLGMLPRLPLDLFLLFFLLILISPFLAQLPMMDQYGLYINLATSLVLSFAVTRLAVYLFIEAPYRLRRQAELPKITRDALLIVMFTVLTFIILRTQGNINLAGLITTSAVLTAVIGFAAQGPLSNFFAGLMIQMERPYVQGDWIRIGDTEGKVTGLTWKATYLETRESIQVYLPNIMIANETFENLSKPDKLVTGVMMIGVEYGAPPNKVREVIFSILKQHPQVLSTPEPEARLIEFGDFAITYEIRFWHRNFPGEPKMKADINDRLWYALRRNSIKIPFPIRDVQHAHIERRREEALQIEARAELRQLLESIPVLKPLSPEELNGLAQQVEGQGVWKTRSGGGAGARRALHVHPAQWKLWSSRFARLTAVSNASPP